MGPRIDRNTRRQGILLAILGLAALAPLSSPARGETGQAVWDREYQIKAAFVYNFIKFVVGGRFGTDQDKPATDADPNRVIRVGVVGAVPSRKGFLELQGKLAKDKPIEVRFFDSLKEFQDPEKEVLPSHPQMGEMRRCHVLFLCPSEKPFLAALLPPLQTEGILLVGDSPGFLEAGGVINLLIEDKKVRFEINLAAAGRAKLQIRSSLLRLAVRTVEHDHLERQDDEGKQTKSKRS